MSSVRVTAGMTATKMSCRTDGWVAERGQWVRGCIGMPRRRRAKERRRCKEAGAGGGRGPACRGCRAACWLVGSCLEGHEAQDSRRRFGARHGGGGLQEVLGGGSDRGWRCFTK